ncbi:MAG TPA: hypothetical protein VKU19_21150 [Bryobacteraceae bacterium]|nr:hypothetical protein [Bryobacteraceae bacterium]
MNEAAGRRFAPLALAALLGAVLQAQTVDIYTEFRRVDPFGAVVLADQALAPREVLSPAVARNGWASFHIVVSVPPKESYFLYVAPNPVSACRVALFREHFVKTVNGWIPDTLQEVTHLPDFGTMPDPDDGIAGQTTRAYLLDLWIPPNADVARFRVEVQLKVGDWVVRPLEVRVMPARYPDLTEAARGKPLSLPSIEMAADAAALPVLRDYLTQGRLPAPPPPLTVRSIIQRNAIQDMALAASMNPDTGGREVLQRRTLDLLRSNLSLGPRLWGGEWDLRLRDYLFNAFIPH